MAKIDDVGGQRARGFAFTQGFQRRSGPAAPEDARGWLDRYQSPREELNPSPTVSDTVKYTTCYMCACRCGIKVHIKDGQLRFIEGNKDHPVNHGVICAKGSAGIMTQNSPAKLRKPLLRTGERGTGEFREIEWDEALTILTERLGKIRDSDPSKLAFFTGRDQSQSLTGFWAAQFGTPNFAAHGGFCSVNMAAAGMYTLGGSFWEFGEPDWDHTRYLLLFGVAEDHDSNPIKIGLSKMKARGAKIVSVNPIKTGYSAIADEWIGIRPGSDGLFVFALIHELLRADRIDAEYLVRYTNAPWLVIQDPGAPDDGLFARDADGAPLAWDAVEQRAIPATAAGIRPALVGAVTLPDGRRAVPSFHLLAERYLDPQHAPEAVAERCGVPADTIRRIAAEMAHLAFQETLTIEQPWTDWAGRRHERMVGRPIAMHAMRGISAHSNGFHTCRAIHILQILLGTIDVPGGWRYKSPYPRPAPPGPKPAGKRGETGPGKAIHGMPLGYPMGPEDLLVDEVGQPLRIDKAFSWDAPLSVHGLMHMVVANAWEGDPYRVDTLFMYMANMAWNSSMNTSETMRMLSDKDPDSGEYRIPFIVYCDAYASEMVAYADLVLADTTYLERWDCISLLDRPIGSAHGPGDSIRQPVLTPDRDVRPFQDVLIELGARLGLPAFVREDGSPRYPGGYPDYMTNHERKPGIGPLAGWRGTDGKDAGKGAPNADQLDRYVRNGCFWHFELPPEQHYFKHANQAYLETATRMGFLDKPEPVILQLYVEPLQKFRLAARGHGAVVPPADKRQRVETYFDPLPFWYPPLEEEGLDEGAFPLHAVTQRPMPMYHSWGSQNAWLRQILARNSLYIARQTAEALGLADGDWAWVTSPTGRIRVPVHLMDGVEAGTVWTWNAIGKRSGAWNLSADAPEGTKGFLLNHLISELLPERNGYRHANADPVTGQAAWYDLRVRVEKAPPKERAETMPRFPAQAMPPGVEPPPAILRTGAAFRSTSRGVRS
ncbi:formate dehydrogenase (plasmid) [Azospirillum argentinense]|uniref:Formate dehydrogenase n=1 Tax=Azospirillum argentinense TaxID=2970906 RepID=A0A060DYF1_9PROT|nr:molybdopterin oxidoreductase family protein [Azospirillum argentinense]AIB16088.1 formate dehydrogenase [Azospirillum argentinense]EZQ02751.1 formate dehydrogenase [Azospirillum argentinense]